MLINNETEIILTDDDIMKMIEPIFSQLLSCIRKIENDNRTPKEIYFPKLITFYGIPIKYF